VALVIPANSHHTRPGGAGPERTRPLRVVIADDHPFYRGRLAISLRRRGFEVIGEVPDGEAAVELAEADAPDVILMDLRMPLLSGLEATRRLTEVAPQRGIVAISASALEDEIADAILWGADAHVPKDRPLEELVAAIDLVANGGIALSPGTAKVVRRRVRGEDGPGTSLTGAPLVRRELELLDRLAEGRSTVEIASATGATPETVAEDIAALLMKLRIEQRIQAAFDDAEGRTPPGHPPPDLEG
jgi:DNA-binding NarL/FixJ family response regulator